MKLFKESHFSGKDAKLRFLNHVHYEARLKAGEFYDQFKKKKGYQILPSTYTYVLLCGVLTSFLHSYDQKKPKIWLGLITRYCCTCTDTQKEFTHTHFCKFRIRIMYCRMCFYCKLWLLAITTVPHILVKHVLCSEYVRISFFCLWLYDCVRLYVLEYAHLH